MSKTGRLKQRLRDSEIDCRRLRAEAAGLERGNMVLVNQMVAMETELPMLRTKARMLDDLVSTLGELRQKRVTIECLLMFDTEAGDSKDGYTMRLEPHGKRGHGVTITEALAALIANVRPPTPTQG